MNRNNYNRMRREIKLALMYRDMWQSSGKYMPRMVQLVRVAEPIIQMGCFESVETNGGGFEQINLLYGENPNVSIRKWTQPFNDAGIQTQMLERGLNGLRMNPVPKDVRRLMFKLKKQQGTDISRSFDGLNNPENLALSFQYAKEGGMIAQGALSMTVSPLLTVEYFIDLADKFIALGAEEICLKDMAGIAGPAPVGKIVKGIREKYPNIIIQYHGHSTPGFSVASALESTRNGADIIDVGMEPLSWGIDMPICLRYMPC
jgi:pyruvate carboxylase subunit B